MANFVRKHGKKAVLFMAVAMISCLVLAVGVFAEGETAQQAINSAVTTALGTVQSDAMTLIASVLPYALQIFGAILVVTIGIRAFKRVTGR